MKISKNINILPTAVKPIERTSDNDNQDYINRKNLFLSNGKLELYDKFGRKVFFIRNRKLSEC